MPEPAFDPDPPAATAPPPPPPDNAGTTGKIASPDAPKQSFDDMTADQYDRIVAADKDLLKKKVGAEGGMEAAALRRDEAYRTRMDRMISAEGATASELKPWNAGEELEKRKTNLWEQFGSPGFVISMMASAFTAMPMNSALNAGAAAMNSINQGDMDSYNKAFDAWKENTNLTLKRAELEEREFNQIDKLRSSNMESWRAAATALATRFNDQRMLALLNNGYDAEALQARDQLTKSRVELSDANKRIQDNDIRRQLTMALNGDNKDPRKLAQAASDAEMIMTAPKTPEQIAVNNVISQPGFRDKPTAEQNKEIEDAVRGVASARYGGRGANAIPTELQKQIDESDANASPDESPDDARTRHNQIMSDFYRAKNPIGAERNRITQEHNETMAALADRKIDAAEARNQEDALHKRNMDAIAKGRLEGQLTAEQERKRHDEAIEEIQKKRVESGGAPSMAKEQAQLVEELLKKENPQTGQPYTREEAIKRAKEAAAPPPTGNKLIDLKSHIGQYDDAIKIIDGIDKTLDRYVGAAGVAGRATRLTERVGNILGSNKTDRTQMMRDIEQLQLMGPRLLLDQKTGRPLSTEAGHISDIIAGLNLGDTTANTKRAMKEIRERLVVIRDRNKAEVPGASAPATSTETTDDKPWENDPVK